MTYLQLCQKVNALAGMQGTFSAVTTATGYQATLAEIVADVWVDIQNLRRNWQFMRATVSFSTIVGQSEYTITNIFGSSTSLVANWIGNMILYNKAADDVRALDNYGYDRFILNEKSQDDNAEPSIFAVDPTDKHLYLNPSDAIYSMTAHYFKKAIVLSVDADVPDAPEEFHRLIAYMATAEFCAGVTGDQGRADKYSKKADVLLGALMRNQIPMKRVRTRGIA
jgi:hypothetical protein